MASRTRVAELEAQVGELQDRLRAVERWALAHEQEQWEHRVFLTGKSSDEKYKAACLARSMAVLKLPGGFEAN